MATIAGGAPMIGFLGTVTGMVQAFWEMSNAGNNIDITLLSGGIYAVSYTHLAYIQAMRCYRSDGDGVAVWHDDRSPDAQRIGCRTGRSGDDQSVRLVGGEIGSIDGCVDGNHGRTVTLQYRYLIPVSYTHLPDGDVTLRSPYLEIKILMTEPEPSYK